MIPLLANSYHFTRRPWKILPGHAGNEFSKQSPCQQKGRGAMGKADPTGYRYIISPAGRQRSQADLPSRFSSSHLHWFTVTNTEIGEALAAGGYFSRNPAFHGVGRGIPKGVKLEIRGGSAKMGFKGAYPFIHDLDRDCPGCLAIAVIGRICDTLPFSLQNLITADFAGAADGLVIVAGFQHREGGEPVHPKRAGG